MKIVFILVFALVFVGAKIMLPNYIKQCYRNDPGLSNCIRENMESLKEIYPKGGLPELGIPFFYPKLEPKVEYHNPFGFYDIFKNFKIWHLDNYTINSVEFGTKIFNVDFYFPSVGFESQFKENGQLLILRIDTDGNVQGNITSLQIKYKATLDTVQRNGEQYLALKSSEIELITPTRSINGLANGVMHLTQSIILQQFTPLPKEILKNISDAIIRNLFSQYPLDMLLPEKQ